MNKILCLLAICCGICAQDDFEIKKVDVDQSHLLSFLMIDAETVEFSPVEGKYLVLTYDVLGMNDYVVPKILRIDEPTNVSAFCQIDMEKGLAKWKVFSQSLTHQFDDLHGYGVMAHINKIDKSVEFIINISAKGHLNHTLVTVDANYMTKEEVLEKYKVNKEFWDRKFSSLNIFLKYNESKPNKAAHPGR